MTDAVVVRRGVIQLIVLIAGMSTMATEMSASRLLAPFFGASVMVWANIIGLILVYLSIGYWLGGRLADRYPTARGLCTVILLAAITIAAVPFIAHPVLNIASGGIDTLNVSSVLGSFVGSLVLFMVPVTLLGMVPPYSVRLALADVKTSGQVSGSLYALSTIGSIIGTFASVLVLIPWIGTQRTMLSFALTLALLSLVGARGRIRIGSLVCSGIIAAAIAFPPGSVRDAQAGAVIYEHESRYQFVQVVREKSSSRVLLELNEGWAIHSLYDPDSVLSHGIWDDFLVGPALAGAGRSGDPVADESRRPMSMLLIGNAAGTVARVFDRYRPNTTIDGVEIDPLVTQVARRYFHMKELERRNLRVYHADGRPFLAHAQRSWDFIHVDAYRQPYIPFYLTTREYFTLVRSHLKPGGVVSINVGSAPDDTRINRAVAITMRSVFPTVVRWRSQMYNEVIIATARPMSAAQLRARVAASDLASEEDVGGLFRRFNRDLTVVRPDPGSVLTDDRAPVEWMTDRMIVGAAQQG